MASAQGVAAAVADTVARRIGASLLASSQAPEDTLLLEVEAGAIRAATEALLGRGARFMVTVGVDTRERSGDFLVLQLYSLDAEQLFVVLECAVAADDPHLESITVSPLTATPIRAGCCSPTTGRRASTRCGATSRTTAGLRRWRASRR